MAQDWAKLVSAAHARVSELKDAEALRDALLAVQEAAQLAAEAAERKVQADKATAAAQAQLLDLQTKVKQAEAALVEMESNQAALAERHTRDHISRLRVLAEEYVEKEATLQAVHAGIVSEAQEQIDELAQQIAELEVRKEQAAKALAALKGV